MASVIFSANYENEVKFAEFNEQVTAARSEAVRVELGHPDGSGFRIGPVLKGFNGSRCEISLSVQSWDEFVVKLKAFCEDLYERHGFEGLRTIGLE